MSFLSWDLDFLSFFVVSFDPRNKFALYYRVWEPRELPLKNRTLEEFISPFKQKNIIPVFP